MYYIFPLRVLATDKIIDIASVTHKHNIKGFIATKCGCNQLQLKLF